MKAQELKQIREIWRIDQTEFGKIFGCSRETISNYERGRSKIPDPLAIVIKLVAARPGVANMVKSMEADETAFHEDIEKLHSEIKREYGQLCK